MSSYLSLAILIVVTRVKYGYDFKDMIRVFVNPNLP